MSENRSVADKENENKLKTFEAPIKKTPLYELKKQIKQAQFELKMLKKNNSDSIKISKLESKISEWKYEYSKRVVALKQKM